jgi:hypothetical protein
MVMRDPMHQIDLSAIVHLIRAILRKFNECVETTLDVCGLAAKRLGQRFRLILAKRNVDLCSINAMAGTAKGVSFHTRRIILVKFR